MKKFKYPLAISGDYMLLISELEKLGYKESHDWNKASKVYAYNSIVFVTNAGGIRGEMAEFHSSHGSSYNRTLVDASNKDLVLALAAMVDDDDKFYEGEWLIALNSCGNGGYIKDVMYKVKRAGSCFIDTIDSTGVDNGWHNRNFRKATKEEIINHFANKETKMENKKYEVVDVEFIKEAYKAACPTWKRKLEEKFPEVLVIKFDVDKIYAFESGAGYKYKLHQIPNGQYCFININNSHTRWGDGDTAEKQIKRVADNNFKLEVFDNLQDFAKWLVEEKDIY